MLDIHGRTLIIVKFSTLCHGRRVVSFALVPHLLISIQGEGLTCHKTHSFFLKCPVQRQIYGGGYQVVRFYVCWRLSFVAF